ncbi:MAG: nucleotidyltransferase domain-containing protein [candidate division KSB1 bacterium]|nr:nucleotidyltransferase domain-containing protein [candidate division KSB1 bacterium]MDZ7300917.1 nucleotidyltransferase domain-containing protein [candidate division KSB1 bacterium]MDZ7314069.1 nucleotidyltransferase domain-containing protein [candidate division KSB1 bacterium]
MKPHNVSSGFAKVGFPDHEKIKQQLTTLAQQAIQQEPKIQAVYLFGSRTTGNFSARSDADLLIIVQDDSQRPIVRIPYYLRLFQNAPVPVEVFPYTMEEARQSAFARRALQQGRLLSMRDSCL